MKLSGPSNIDAPDRPERILDAHGATPDPARADMLLGVAEQHRANGQHEWAESTCNLILEVNPEHHGALHLLGVLRLDVGNCPEARHYIDLALDLDPLNPVYRRSLGNILRAEDDLDGAAEQYREALARDPDYAEAYVSLGMILEEMGIPGEAEASFLCALEIKPRLTEIYYLMEGVHKHTGHDDSIHMMEELYKDYELSDEQRMYLCFAMGKAFDDLKQYEKAFWLLEEANRLKRKYLSYDIEYDRKQFDQIKELFHEITFIRNAGSGFHDPAPIFILGMPCSGTALVEQIIGGHLSVHEGGEMPFLEDVVCRVGRVITRRKYPASFLRMERHHFEELGEEYIRRIRLIAPNDPRITDSRPVNFKYIGMIRLILPEAKIIHCVRDSMEVCLSLYRDHFKESYPYAYDLTEMGTYYLLYQDLLDHWQTVQPHHILTVYYEDLMASTEEQVRAILEFCELGYDDACLDSLKSDKAILSAGVVEGAHYSPSVNHWKHYYKWLEPLGQIIKGW